MHKDFEKYRPGKADSWPDKTKGTMQLNVRTSPELLEQLRTLAKIEGDTLAALVTEGMARVIEDRLHNPDPQLQAGLLKQRDELARGLDSVQQLIDLRQAQAE